LNWNLVQFRDSRHITLLISLIFSVYTFSLKGKSKRPSSVMMLPEQLAIARAKGPHRVAAYDLHKAAPREIFGDHTTAATAARHERVTPAITSASSSIDRTDRSLCSPMAGSARTRFRQRVASAWLRAIEHSRSRSGS
jgi:hypothetical protein